MNSIYYDSGTTNTRAYLFEGRQLLYKLSAEIGSKDCALSGSNMTLLRSLKNMYDELLRISGLTEDDIQKIWMSGMISSSTGILEIPHLTVPVDLHRIREGVVEYFEPLCFKRALHIIPGVKTSLGSEHLDYENFTGINNMRGEETEIFGILEQYPSLMENSILILPGSHTQITVIQNGAITDIHSTITGELYHAIVQHTILSASLASNSENTILPHMVSKGFHALQKLGFNRALYTIRTMDLFLHSSPAERRSYFEGILNGGVAISALSLVVPGSHPQIAVYGNANNLRIFRTLFNELSPNLTFTGIGSKDLPYSAQGFLCIASPGNTAASPHPAALQNENLS